jgi:hypothetical protein
MDAFTTEIWHWIPTPILAALLVWFVRGWLKGHEDKLSALVQRLEMATSRVVDHDSALLLLKRETDRHEKEILKLRDRQHELGEDMQNLSGRLEGSGPKHWPKRRGEDDE